MFGGLGRLKREWGDCYYENLLVIIKGVMNTCYFPQGRSCQACRMAGDAVVQGIYVVRSWLGPFRLASPASVMGHHACRPQYSVRSARKGEVLCD